MPLASFYTLHWYGPAASASVTTVAPITTFDVKGDAKPASSTTGVAAITFAKPTRLVNSPSSISALGQFITALPKGRAKPSIVIRVNTITQDDVTGAVLEAEVENGLSLKEAMRLLLAVMAGKASGAGGSTITFKNPADTKSRVVAAVDGSGNRTSITYDTSDG